MQIRNIKTPQSSKTLPFSFSFYSPIVYLVYENYRAKDTGVLSIWMMICWTLWTPFFAAAAIAKHLVAPNIIQPNIFVVFTTVCGVQIHLYKYAL